MAVAPTLETGLVSIVVQRSEKHPDEAHAEHPARTADDETHRRHYA
jgi:hypothetical protein